MEQFPRIKRLPPYVFNITGELKAAARKRGEDVIDFGMGNPDQPTPRHIVEKLIETAQRGDTHRYSVSRRASCGCARRSATGTSGASTSISIPSARPSSPSARRKASRTWRWPRSMPATSCWCPIPAIPIHIYGPVHRRRRHPARAHAAGRGFLRRAEQAIKDSYPKPKMLILNFPSNPTTQCVELAFFERIVALAREYGIYVVHDLAYADIVFDGYRAPSILQVPGAKDVAVEFFTLSKSYNMAGWRVGLHGRQPRSRGRAGAHQELSRLRHLHADPGRLDRRAGGAAGLRRDRSVRPTRSGATCCAPDCMRWAGTSKCPKASMYVWAPIPEAYRSVGSLEFAKKLLADAKVAVSPGHRIRPVRRRSRALLPDRERGPDAPGVAWDQGDVPQGRAAPAADGAPCLRARLIPERCGRIALWRSSASPTMSDRVVEPELARAG